MSAANHDIVIDQGTSFVLDIAVKEDSIAKSLVNYSARAQMRLTKSASSVVGTFTCTIPTPSNGVIKMELSPSTSSAIAAGSYFYDLEIHTAADAIVKRIIEGRVTLTQEVTR